MLKKIFLFLLLFFISVIGVIIGILSEFYPKDRIFLGIRISNIYVGGLKKEEAEKLINFKVSKKMENPLVLILDEKYYLLKLSDLNIKYKVKETVEEAYKFGRDRNIFLQILIQQKIAKEGVDIPLKFSIDMNKLEEKIEEIAKIINEEPLNAQILFEEKKILKEKTGYRLKKENSISKIVENLKNFESNLIKLEIEKIIPKITEEKLKRINLDTPLAFYSTKFNPFQRKRVHNIKLAAKSIDGYVLLKDEIFSYNKIVGPREAKYGYLEAPVIIKGKLVPKEGGGACQVSSTLFNVALLAGFEILERIPHSRPSTYVPLGRDATVVYDYIDFKFKQDTQDIVILHTKVEKNTLTIYAYGENPQIINTKISYIYKKLIPNKIKEIREKNLEYGKKIIEEKGNPGYNVGILRIVKKHGKIIKRDIIKSNYKPVDRVVKIGIGSPT
jgi:vancomycin resistance protein YoaR